MTDTGGRKLKALLTFDFSDMTDKSAFAAAVGGPSFRAAIEEFCERLRAYRKYREHKGKSPNDILDEVWEMWIEATQDLDLWGENL